MVHPTSLAIRPPLTPAAGIDTATRFGGPRAPALPGVAQRARRSLVQPAVMTPSLAPLPRQRTEHRPRDPAHAPPAPPGRVALPSVR